MGYTAMRALLILAVGLTGAAARAQVNPQSTLPDAPSAAAAQQQDVVLVAEASLRSSGKQPESCTMVRALRMSPPRARIGVPRHACEELFNPYQRFLDTRMSFPLTPRQKGYLALHNLVSPPNLMTIAFTSAFTVGIDSHTAYGPGWKGFGKSAGVSLLQDATGEFFGSFLIPSLVHQDPRYFRMGEGSVRRRFFHAISRTVVAQNDDGSLMPNYATLLTYPINAELSNLYVPGIHDDASSTMARIATGLAIDPANNLIVEFLPDVARHINIRIIFVQRILNQVASQQSGMF